MNLTDLKLGPSAAQSLLHQKLPANELADKCREFEAVLAKKMLEAMQPKNGLFGSGVQGEFYRGLFLDTMAAELSKNPGLGLAESIYRALNPEKKE